MKFGFEKIQFQLFLKKNYKEAIAVFVVITVLLIAWIIRLSDKPRVIEPPTQQDYEEAAKKGRRDCVCWDETIEICLPKQVCQIRE